MSEHQHSHLYIGSRNPHVATIVSQFGFYEEKNNLHLPMDIKIYVLKHIVENFSFEYISEYFRKKPWLEGPFRSFLRVPN